MTDPTPLTITLTTGELAFLSSRHAPAGSPVTRNLGIPEHVDPEGEFALQGAQSLAVRDVLDVVADSWEVAPFVGLIGGAVAQPHWSLLASSGNGEAVTSVRFLGTQTARIVATPGPLRSTQFMLLRDDADIEEILVSMAVDALSTPSGSMVLAWEVTSGQPTDDGLALARRDDIVRWRSQLDADERAGVTSVDDAPDLVRGAIRSLAT